MSPNPEQIEHINVLSRRASAPYNFVPLPEKVVTVVSQKDLADSGEDAGRLLDEHLPDHDRFVTERNTGYFEVQLETRSPLYIRGPLSAKQNEGRSVSEFAQAELEKEGKNVPDDFRQLMKNKPEFFFTSKTNLPVIPGSSLRGMLRNIFEIITWSKVQWVDNSSKFYFRAVASPKSDPLSFPYKDGFGKFGANVRAGYLKRKGEECFIHPAQTPDQFGLGKGKAFLTVKENTIPQGSVPGLIRLNSHNYVPQYHHVFFDAKAAPGAHGPVVRITNVSATKISQAYQGILVCTGNMLETNGNQSSPRKNFSIVLPTGDKVKPLRIHPQAVIDYVDGASAFEKQNPPFDSKHGCLMDGYPVFYLEPLSGQDVLSFGHCPNFRIAALEGNRVKLPIDLVPESLRRVADIDYTEAVFGYVRSGADLKKWEQAGLKKFKQGHKSRGYAGRVYITQANLASDSGDIFEEEIDAKILAGPKATTFQHYLVQTDAAKENLKHFGSPTPQETVLRGHKFYWFKGNVPIDKVRETSEDWIDPATGRVKASSAQHTSFKAVKAGKTFRFRVYFKNLNDIELGALKWALELPGANCCHALGMGKPFGMGAVKLHPTLILADRSTRYESLFNAEGSWETGEEETKGNKFLQAYLNEFIKTQVGEDKYNYRISRLRKLLEWPSESADLSEKEYMADLKIFSERKVLPDALDFDITQAERNALPQVQRPVSTYPRPEAQVPVRRESFHQPERSAEPAPVFPTQAPKSEPYSVGAVIYLKPVEIKLNGDVYLYSNKLPPNSEARISKINLKGQNISLGQKGNVKARVIEINKGQGGHVIFDCECVD